MKNVSPIVLLSLLISVSARLIYELLDKFRNDQYNMAILE